MLEHTFIILGSILYIIEGYLYDHLMSTRISLSIMHRKFIWVENIMRQRPHEQFGLANYLAQITWYIFYKRVFHILYLGAFRIVSHFLCYGYWHEPSIQIHLQLCFLMSIWTLSNWLASLRTCPLSLKNGQIYHSGGFDCYSLTRVHCLGMIWRWAHSACGKLVKVILSFLRREISAT